METKNASVRMLYRLLTPVVRLMIELGIDFRTFSDTARKVYVDVARREYGLRGRPTNTSRIALLTGINRRDVARLREEPIEADVSEQSNLMGRVLSGWYQDAEFQDGDGQPRPLAVSGEWEKLLDRYGGDVPSTAIIKELQRVEAVTVDGDRIKPLTRYYMPFELDARSLARYGSVMSDIADTINFNLLLRDKNEATRFEGRAVNPNVSRRAYREFRELLDREGERFLEQIDKWLTDHETASQEPALRLGVGVYLIRTDDDSQEKPS